MSVSKKILSKQMERLELNYGKDKFKINQGLFNLWYDFFKDCNEDGLKLAVDRCIRENEYAPNIAGLMKHYQSIKEAHEQLVDSCSKQYQLMCAIWGEEYDSETFSQLWTYVNRFPENTRKTELTELTQKAVAFRQSCDDCGRKDYPTIKEYLKGAR